MLDVRLLGEQRISGDDVNRATSARSLELLAILVSHADAPQRRQQLAGTLWPDSAETQARTNLRRELHNLRATLDDDPCLEIQALQLTWHDSATCRVDVRSFEIERHAAEQSRDAGDVAGGLTHARAAIELYQGDFMPGLYHDWVLAARSELLQSCVRLCDWTVDSLRARGAGADAVDVARRRVQLEPLEEAGYRTLMELQIEAGDRAAAISTFHRCSELLERELECSPDPSTSAIVERLVRRHESAASSELPEIPRRRGVAPVPLVGRDGELASLIRLWRRADAGDANVAVVAGEPGVGKTRLVEELAAFVTEEGAVTASARCFGHSGRPALEPVAQWLRSPAIHSAAMTLEASAREEVDRLVPRGNRGGRGARSPRPGDPDAGQPEADGWARLRFFDGLSRAMLATGRPTLLVLDDVQWCDSETIAWLTFLLGASDGARLMVAVTVRPAALREDRELAAALRGLRAAEQVVDVEIAPLDATSTAQLAARLRGQPMLPSDEELLLAATGGYPLFVVEVVQTEPRGTTPNASSTLPDLDGVLRRRLEEVSPEARDVARLAAAIGSDFSLNLLLEASDLDSVVLVDAVDELWLRRIFVERHGRYDFSHDLLRDAAYASVTTARRWLLHRRVAQGLELLHGEHLEAVAPQLAQQYLLGGRRDRALTFFRQAAARASSVFANAEAIRQLRRCLELIAELPDGSDRDVRELDALQAISAPLNALQGYGSAELQSALQCSVTLADRLGRRDVLVRNLVGLFAVRFVQGHTTESHGIAARALALSGDDADLLGQAHFAFAGSASSLGLLEVAIEHFDIAISLSPDSVALVVGTRPEVHSRAWSAHAMWLLGDEKEAIRRSDEAVLQGRSLGQPYTLAVALAYAAITNLFLGDEAALRESVAELRALCRRHEIAYYGEWGLIIDGWLAKDDRGLAQVRLGINSLRALGTETRAPFWLSLLSESLLALGRTEEACGVLDAAIVAAEQRDDRWWLPEVLRLRARLTAGDRSVDLLQQGLDLATSQSSRTLAARCVADLASPGVRGHGT
jgi:DNA-binding SARP family transcriptional activator/tetratricopeptide (TPR) repeat protein